MTPQILDRVLTAYRIGDPAGAHPIYDATGSILWPGRWNTVASPIIYTSEHYSTAMLEKLAHGNGRIPPNQHWIEIMIPPGISYEMFSIHHHAGWDAEDCLLSKAYGETWQQSNRSVVLLVPSVVARMDSNILINPGHPDCARITHGLHQPIWWDRRLFSSSIPPPTAPAGTRRRPRR